MVITLSLPYAEQTVTVNDKYTDYHILKKVWCKCAARGNSQCWICMISLMKAMKITTETN